MCSKSQNKRETFVHHHETTEITYILNDKRTSESKMIRDTNQKDARGAVIRTGRRVGEAGHAEGSYQESASSLGPG